MSVFLRLRAGLRAHRSAFVQTRVSIERAGFNRTCTKAYFAVLDALGMFLGPLRAVRSWKVGKSAQSRAFASSIFATCASRRLKMLFNSRLTLADTTRYASTARAVSKSQLSDICAWLALAAAAGARRATESRVRPRRRVKADRRRAAYFRRVRAARSGRRRRPDAAQAPQESGSHPAGQSR